MMDTRKIALLGVGVIIIILIILSTHIMVLIPLVVLWGTIYLNDWYELFFTLSIISISWLYIFYSNFWHLFLGIGFLLVISAVLHNQLYEKVVLSRNYKDWVYIIFGLFGGYLGWQFISIFIYHSFPNPINIFLGFFGGFLIGSKLKKGLIAVFIGLLISAIGSALIQNPHFPNF